MHWDVIYRNIDYFLIGPFPKAKLPALALLVIVAVMLFLALRWLKEVIHDTHLSVVETKPTPMQRIVLYLGTPLLLTGLWFLVLEPMYPEPLFDTCWDAIDNFDRLGGITMSIILAALGIFGAFWVGLVVGLMRQSKRRIFKYPSMAYIEVIRGVPLIMLIFWFFFLAPMLLGQAMPKFWTTLVAFIIFTSAYIAEIVRAGIQSLPSGQTEAARGTGLSGIQSMMFVILPQALRNMIPSFVNQFVSLTKDTSLASIIGVNELFLSANQVNQRELTAPMEVFTTIAVMYFVICYVLTATSRRLERQMARYQARDR